MAEKLSKLFTPRKGHLTTLGLSYTREKDLPSKVQKRADGHLAVCGRCRRRLERMSRIISFARSVLLAGRDSLYLVNPRKSVKSGKVAT